MNLHRLRIETNVVYGGSHKCKLESKNIILRLSRAPTEGPTTVLGVRTEKVTALGQDDDDADMAADLLPEGNSTMEARTGEAPPEV